MQVIQKIVRKTTDLAAQASTLSAIDPDLILVFGSVDHLSNPNLTALMTTAAR
jgi:hypothetical protein